MNMDTVTFFLALWGSLLSTILALRELRRDKRQLKIILEKGSSSVQELKEKLYAAGASGHMPGTEMKDGQRRFFIDIYNLLFGADQGPKLDSFLFSAKKNDILRLLHLK